MNIKKIKLYFLVISIILLKSCQYERKAVVLQKIYKEKEEYQTPVHINYEQRSEIGEKYFLVVLVVDELIVNVFPSFFLRSKIFCLKFVEISVLP